MKDTLALPHGAQFPDEEDGQDMDLKYKHLGTTVADSYGDALRAFDNPDMVGMPPNWKFQLLRVGDQHEYPTDNLEVNPP